MKPKGTIPIPYLVALIIGLIIIGVIAYMFVTKTGIFAGFVTEQECSARLKAYCMEWATAGWKTRGKGKDEFKKFFAEYAPECKEIFDRVAGVNVEAFDRNDYLAKRVCKEQFGLS